MRRDWKRTAVLALIAAALLAAAALAVATVLDPAFLEHFGAGPKDEPLLGKTAVDVNLTAEPRELVYVGTGCTAGGPATEGIGTFFIRRGQGEEHRDLAVRWVLVLHHLPFGDPVGGAGDVPVLLPSEDIVETGIVIIPIQHHALRGGA